MADLLHTELVKPSVKRLSILTKFSKILVKYCTSCRGEEFFLKILKKSFLQPA